MTAEKKHCSKYTYKIQTFSCFVKHDLMTIYRSIKDCFCSFRNACNTQKRLLSVLFIAKENYSTTENLKWKFNHINSYGTKNYLQPIQWSLQSKLLLFQNLKKKIRFLYHRWLQMRGILLFKTYLRIKILFMFYKALSHGNISKCKRHFSSEILAHKKC